MADHFSLVEVHSICTIYSTVQYNDLVLHESCVPFLSCAVVSQEPVSPAPPSSSSAQPQPQPQAQAYPFPTIMDTPSPRLGLAVMLADPYTSRPGSGAWTGTWPDERAQKQPLTPAPQTVPLPCRARVPPHAFGVGTPSVTWIKNGAPINLTRHPRYMYCTVLY